MYIRECCFVSILFSSSNAILYLYLYIYTSIHLYLYLFLYLYFQTRTWPLKGSRRYLIPFGLLMSILLLLRLIPGLEDALSGGSNKQANSVLAPKFNLGGYSSVDFPWLSHSGIIVSCIAIVTPWIVPYYKPDPALNLSFPKEANSGNILRALNRAKYVNRALSKFKKNIIKRRKAEETKRKYREVVKESFCKYNIILIIYIYIYRYTYILSLFAI